MSKPNPNIKNPTVHDEPNSNILTPLNPSLPYLTGNKTDPTVYLKNSLTSALASGDSGGDSHSHPIDSYLLTPTLNRLR